MGSLVGRSRIEKNLRHEIISLGAKKLLNEYQISTKANSYHLNNEHKKVDDYIELMVSGKKISLITDAGTHCISYPGFLLIP